MPLQQELEAAVLSGGGDPGRRCLALLHAATCIGRFDAVDLLHGLADRLTVTAAHRREAALQVVAYSGFPRAIEGLARLASHPTQAAVPPSVPTAPATDSRPPLDPGATERRLSGRAVWERVYAGQSDEVLRWLGVLAPELPGWVLDDVYGRVLSRPGLALAERELLGVAALALMALPSPLASHIRGALRNGVNAGEVSDTLRACRCLATPEALATIEQALQRLDRNVLRP